MKDDLKRNQKVSLLFYSESEGKKALIDKWKIEVGKKYNIGRSKKKVDISIQDITISRNHSEFIFYDKDKIMIKDLNSSNGTYINNVRIEPNQENYFSIRDHLSIGNEKNQLVFSIEKGIKNDSADEKKVNYNLENRNEENLKNYNENKRNNEKSDSLHNEFSSRKNRYYNEEDKKYNYNTGKIEKNKKFQNNKYRSRSRSRSRDDSKRYSPDKNSNKKYHKRNHEYKRNKRKHSKNFSHDSEKSPKKNKHKNILSYIVKREEEIEKENDKRQIALYNEYLKVKQEVDEKLERNSLPSLLPVLKDKTPSEENDIDSLEDISENRKEYIKLPNFKRNREGRLRRFNKFDIKYKRNIIYPKYRKRFRGYKKSN